MVAQTLERKQEMLNIPKRTLIHDVTTRLNSSYDMLERYLEQQAGVSSALTEKTLKKNKDQCYPYNCTGLVGHQANENPHQAKKNVF